MQAPPWKTHLLRPRRVVEAGKYAPDLFDQSGVQSTAIIIFEEPPQAAMPKPTDHFMRVW